VFSESPCLLIRVRGAKESAMERGLRERFRAAWERYFPGAELPIGFWYTNGDAGVQLAKTSEIDRCLMANLERVRAGTPMRFSVDSIGCPGGRRYCGFSETLMPQFNYFLSHGIPGKVEGERYKKTPELVAEVMAHAPKLKAPGTSIVFKPWDHLTDTDDPAAVIFVATPDVLAGLFTLANFDEAEQIGVIAPFGAGCGTVVLYPYLEQQREHPRCVLGAFDPSARPYVPANTLTFAAPMKKFVTMVADMDESFLITPTWSEVTRRFAPQG
jgi:hypothetical protein